MKTINILGSEYEILEHSEIENPKLKTSNGLCELYSKQIVLNKDVLNNPTEETFEKLELFKNKVIRHEVIHAYFHESGLDDYGSDEKLVNWLAIQFNKMAKTFSELEV